MATLTTEPLGDTILTQQGLQQRLKAEGLTISTSVIHACLEAGMPAVRLPGLKKPRFHWDECWKWITTARDLDPLTIATRDKLYRRMRGAR